MVKHNELPIHNNEQNYSAPITKKWRLKLSIDPLSLKKSEAAPAAVLLFILCYIEWVQRHLFVISGSGPTLEN